MKSKVPAFFDSKKSGKLFQPNMETLTEAALLSGWTPSEKEPKMRRTVLLVIDPQIGFCIPGNDPDFPGTLSVPGAVDDMFRLAKFIYTHGSKIYRIFASLDTHHAFSIFHPSWWVDENGKPVSPFTLITAADITSGKYRPVVNPVWSLGYPDKLAERGNQALCIWPFHCLQGSVDGAILPILFEAFLYHSLARLADIGFLVKGNEANTEMYGILEPEIPYAKSRVGTARGLNVAFLEMLAENKYVIVAGEAKSHCVLETLKQMVAFFKTNDPDMLKKMIVLEDCTSPVPAIVDNGKVIVDFSAIANAQFAEFAKLGVKFIKSTDDLDAVLL